LDKSKAFTKFPLIRNIGNIDLSIREINYPAASSGVVYCLAAFNADTFLFENGNILEKYYIGTTY
jgi:hypothetical protein